MRIHPLFLYTAFAARAFAEDISGTLFNANGQVIPGARALVMSEDYIKLSETKSRSSPLLNPRGAPIKLAATGAALFMESVIRKWFTNGGPFG